MSEALAVKTDIVQVAKGLIGSPCIKYVPRHPELGQSATEGFDCSGFVTYVLRQAGFTIPQFVRFDGTLQDIRHTNEFFDYYGIAIHKARRQPGDLIFFTADGWRPTHMGIVVAHDTYVHAPGHDNEHVTAAPIVNSLVDFPPHPDHRRIYNENPIGYKAPVAAAETPNYRVHQRAL